MILNDSKKDISSKNCLKVNKNNKNDKSGANLKTLKKASTLDQNNTNNNNININFINNTVISKSFCQPIKKMNFK